MAPWYSHVTTM